MCGEAQVTQQDAQRKEMVQAAALFLSQTSDCLVWHPNPSLELYRAIAPEAESLVKCPWQR